MIRQIIETSKTELDEIMAIWLEVNRETHEFIDENYWLEQFAFVKQAIQQATLVACYDESKIIGFIGLVDDYIAGIFVRKDHQNQGIGSKLLSFVKVEKKTLTLSVYCKNQQAINFYLKHDFKISIKQVDELTQEEEYTMIWERE